MIAVDCVAQATAVSEAHHRCGRSEGNCDSRNLVILPRGLEASDCPKRASERPAIFMAYKDLAC